MPKNEIAQIKYFTARVNARDDDPGQPMRQQLYFRALRTLPNLSIHYGHFLSHGVWMPQYKNPKKRVQVLKTEEKGSDVNLASHLLHDAHMNKFDVAVIISNDSDLETPVRIVNKELKKAVGILNPHSKPGSKPSRSLMGVSSFYKPIRAGVLKDSQFPDQLTDTVGTFTKPSSW